MSESIIDAGMLSRMFLAGAKNLEAKQELINELNVFPVPDGDTGTNMTATIMSAASEVAGEPGASMEVLCKSISSGSLRGARGNSGVILSQLLRGFTKVVKKHEEADAALIADAFEKAVETAYKAVMKPKEGTILTVARGASEQARALVNEGVTDLNEFFTGIIDYAEEVLSKTPEMLPVLKEAGVVDSGGKGLVEVLKGAYDGFLGRGIPFDQPVAGSAAPESREEEKLRFAYCVVLRIILEKPLGRKQMTDIKSFLNSVGEELKVAEAEGGFLIHLHTDDPGLVLQRALMYGMLREVSVKDIRTEGHVSLPEGKPVAMDSLDKEVIGENGESKTQAASEQPPAERKAVGFVAVCAGVGMAEIFKSLGCDAVIEGGQTLNPSTADILEACARVNADTVFILPNNKNIILAADQAKAMSEGQSLVVIPTKTMPQGITALVNVVPEESADENERLMREAIGTVASGEVTYAVRDTMIDGQQIRQGDYMGIGDSGILQIGSNRVDVASAMIEKLMESGGELVSIYYGEDVVEDEAAVLLDRVNTRFPEVEVELQYGGQPIYAYIVSIE